MATSHGTIDFIASACADTARGQALPRLASIGLGDRHLRPGGPWNNVLTSVRQARNAGACRCN